MADLVEQAGAAVLRQVPRPRGGQRRPGAARTAAAAGAERARHRRGHRLGDTCVPYGGARRPGGAVRAGPRRRGLGRVRGGRPGVPDLGRHVLEQARRQQRVPSPVAATGRRAAPCRTRRRCKIIRPRGGTPCSSRTPAAASRSPSPTGPTGTTIVLDRTGITVTDGGNTGNRSAGDRRRGHRGDRRAAPRSVGIQRGARSAAGRPASLVLGLQLHRRTWPNFVNTRWPPTPTSATWAPPPRRRSRRSPSRSRCRPSTRCE